MDINISLIGAYYVLKPLIVFILGMSVYSFFIFKFYRFLASRDVINLNLFKFNNSNHWMIGSFLAIMFYTLEYLIVLPLIIFFWFAVLAFLLAFLSKNQSLETVLLVAIAVVGTVRIAAFYKEDLARDLAKMLPFALLGVFLIDISFFNVSETFSMLTNISTMIETLIYYLGFIILLEFILRIFHLIFGKPDEITTKEEK